ncbi:MBL fold metallo-hydrolase [Aminiphilus sp.]|uniref:MBL fold metallo-hydrolase n=1 Tax=Aminiphilus sp. TaxID=1872488 RepID=UPI002612C2E6|nr:MBL fold metallo-hydrolase [Aminiphilus sp.]
MELQLGPVHYTRAQGEMSMLLTTVTDDLCGKADLLGECGLALYLETPRGTVLFDAGSGTTILGNLRALGFSPSGTDALVLSHGHADHAGGVPQLLSVGLSCPLWTSPRVTDAHYARRDGIPRYMGLHLAPGALAVRPVTEPTQVLCDVWAFPVPGEKRDPDFVPSTPHLLLREGEEYVPDPFEDELSLVVEGIFGISVILGCAHAGVVNILEAAAAFFGTRAFYSVSGGMHLKGQNAVFLERTVETLRSRFDVKHWRPCHCTGFTAAARLAEAMESVEWAASGSRVEL